MHEKLSITALSQSLVCICVCRYSTSLYRLGMNQSKISVMQLGDEFKLWITYQVDIYLDEQRCSGWWCITAFSCSVWIAVFSSHHCVCVCVIEHTDVQLSARVRGKNMPKLHSYMNLLTSELISLCGISQQTEMGDEKSRGWEPPGAEMVV